MKQAQAGHRRSQVSISKLYVSIRLLITRLNHFQVPRRELIPKEFVNSHHCFTQDGICRTESCHFSVLVLSSCILNHLTAVAAASGCSIVESTVHPLIRPESIPYLIVKITSLFAQRIIKQEYRFRPEQPASFPYEHHQHRTYRSVLTGRGNCLTTWTSYGPVCHVRYR